MLFPLAQKAMLLQNNMAKRKQLKKTDIYGLGATLHELLTGDDPSLTLFNFKPVPAGKRGKLPIASQLYALLKQMIEMNMSKRPASMALVKQVLQKILFRLDLRKISWSR